MRVCGWRDRVCVWVGYLNFSEDMYVGIVCFCWNLYVFLVFMIGVCIRVYVIV